MFNILHCWRVFAEKELTKEEQFQTDPLFIEQTNIWYLHWSSVCSGSGREIFRTEMLLKGIRNFKDSNGKYAIKNNEADNSHISVSANRLSQALIRSR